MSVKQDPSEDEEGNHGPEVPLVETNRFGFIIGNGETDSEGPCPELVRHRESKWLGLMTQWEQVMEKKSHKVKSQCQKGIPASVRIKCWPLLCGAKDRKENNSTLYNSLVEAPDHQGWIEIIKRDTDRQFPFHEMFLSKDGHGQKDLLEVLKAYTQYRPDEGYCQAQGPVAAVLLMNMPAEEAFWCLVQISELYLPGYYSPLLEGVLFDAAVLSSVLKKLCPAAHKHLQGQGVEPLMFATDWLMCLFSRHLPFNTLLRVWDLFFCYGVRVLFQVAVVLVRRCLGDGRLRKECDGQMETLERLRSVKQRVQNEQTDAFINEVCSVSLSLADLQKQTEKELEKWKKDRPNSTFDPRGRCHGHRMAWERAQNKQKEQEKKERQKGSLTIPIMRSHSSLSPSLLRKKWRKRSSKTDTEEWDGGGRKSTRSLMEESDEEEIRRRSLCAVIGEQKAKQDRLLDDLCAPKHKDHNTHPPKISLIASSSIDSDVFEKEPSEISLRRQTGDSKTTHGNEKRRSPGCIIEESMQRHQHTVEKDRKQDDIDTEAQIIQNTDEQTCQDEQIVQIKVTLEPCEENTPVENEDKQTDSSKQEEEIQSDRDIQEEDIQTEEGKLDVTEHEDSLQNIPDIHIDVIPEEQMSQTSGDLQDDHEHPEELDVSIQTATEDDKQTPPIGEHHTDVDKEKSFHEEFNFLPEKTQIADPTKMAEEKGDRGLVEEEVHLEQQNDHQEAIQTSEVVLTSSSLQTEEKSEIEHPDRSADLIQQSQLSDPENKDMDIIIIGEELANCPVDSTVGDLLQFGNPEMSDAGGTNPLEPQEETVALRLSEDNSMAAATVIASDDTSQISSENTPAVSANTECCEIKTTEELCNITQSLNTDNKMNATKESVTPESSLIDSDVGSLEGNDKHVTTRSGNLENNMTDVITGSEMPESSDMQTAAGTDNSETNAVDSTVEDSESSQVVITTESGNLEQSENPENEIVDLFVGSDNSEIIEKPVIAGTDHVCNTMHQNDESGNPDGNTLDSDVSNPENIDVVTTSVFGSPECNDILISCASDDSGSNIVNLADGSGNQDQKQVDVTTGHENPESNEMEIAVGAVDSDGSNVEKTDSNKMLATTESGNVGCNDIQVTSGSGNLENKDVSLVESGQPDNEKVAISKSAHPETNKKHVTAASGNPTEESAAGSDNPPNTECATPANSQDFESPFPIPSSKSPHPNVPPSQLRVRRTSSSRVFYPTILSEDTFKEPQQQEHTQTEMTAHTLTDDTNVQPTSPTKSGQKRMGLFRRLRGENSKTPIPKILIQDFSEKDERLTSKERRRRKREKERKEKEEKDRKKQEREMEKDKERERKKPQTRGKSFQVLSKKGVDNAESGNSDFQTSRTRRNSAPFSDSYF
ncbi:uncharacterized protein tbc1d10c [Danio rerio]|uniref:Uncharacterized protein tbc1d10c n=2 Tax=Danio rerio TaxID=7955 RepID=A0AC58H7E4_DANRE|nr:nestin [Danio rerio]|eukprot:XP_021328450.1 nestin [Danio rerio]